MNGKDIEVINKADFGSTMLEPLRELGDCPKQVFLWGTLPVRADYRYLTIVGSRAHSAYAKEALEQLIQGLAGQPICIVSGLAYGVDALAHTLALANKLPTIALPGSGLGSDVLYPAGNQSLAQEIVRQGGAVISEFEPEVRAARWTFPKRNRLMAMLADMVLVVEAGEQSGTLITARNASEYSRDVGVVPAGIFSETARGSNNLLKEGAHPVLSAQDIVELLGLEYNKVARKARDDISQDEQAILDKLTSPQSREELAQATDMEAAELASLLTLLEIKGYIKEEVGQIRKI